MANTAQMLSTKSEALINNEELTVLRANNEAFIPKVEEILGK